MVIKFVMLGFLNWRSLSGYDLKKLIGDNSFLHWSGNNNQIYKALVQLHTDGWVSAEFEQQNAGPARKTYSITEQGRLELKAWVRCAPVLPEFRNTFLMQLAWADLLSASELVSLLSAYRTEVEAQLFTLRGLKKRITKHPSRASISPTRTAREALLWEKVFDHQIALYEAELTWLQGVERDLEMMSEQRK
jgi:PadR family transcriptional regulator, regulatory protein AphA